MAPGKVVEWSERLLALKPRVQVALVGLRLAEQGRGRNHEILKLRSRLPAELPCDRLERLVDVGVGEPLASILGACQPGQAAQVVERARVLQAGDAVRNRRRGVEVLPGSEVPGAVQCDCVMSHRLQHIRQARHGDQPYNRSQAPRRNASHAPSSLSPHE
jgi:hypothetical protein